MSHSSLWKDLKGIVLDAVGTLIEPSPSVPSVYAAVASKQGVELGSEEIRNRFYRHFRNDEVDESRGPLITDESIELARWKRIVANVLPEVPDQESAFEKLWNHFADPRSWRCFADVRPAVRAMLDSGIKVRIASNFDGRLHRVMEGLPDLEAIKEGVVISSEVGFRKPHHFFYKEACARLGLEPENVLCVGDDIENDVMGPARFGLRSVLIDRRATAESSSRSFTDLLQLWECRLAGGNYALGRTAAADHGLDWRTTAGPPISEDGQ